MIIHRTGKINFLLVFFYIGGCMKRFLALLMCIFVLTISIITYFPTNIYAATDFTLSIDWKSVVQGKPNLSYTEAHNAVANHGNIYGSDHIMVFQYTPTSTYNWTLVGEEHVMKLNMSDKQLEAYLQCNNYLATLGHLYNAYNSNNSIGRYLMTKIGALVSDDSPLTTACLDTITNNVNYLNAVEYDPNTGNLTLLADQVTALRKELKDRYYNLIGLKIFNSSDNVHIGLSSSKFKNFYQYQEDYASDFATFYDYDYMFLSNETAYFFNNFEYAYYNLDENLYFSATSDRLAPIYFIYSDTVNKLPSDGRVVVSSGYDNVNSSLFFNNVLNIRCNADYGEFALYYGANKNSSDTSYTYDRYGFSASTFYGNKSLRVFKSYSAYYNYVHGDENAYLSSKVEEAGEDIKLSINDMNDNIGSKIDDLIDSINNKKEGMSADELQDAIDKALDSISGKIDDIGDNTEETNNKLDALLEAISGTNEILMQILGVTTDIRHVVKTTDEEGNQYTMSDVKDCFNTMYNNLKYSILYGKNVTNNPDAANVSTAAYVSYSDVSTYADTSAETLDYKDGLFGKFPFSVPYQMYEWLQVLQTKEKVPQFTYNYGFLIGQKGKQEYDLTFDLSAYQSWADVLKSFLRLSFTLIMSVFIYNKFKGEI